MELMQYVKKEGGFTLIEVMIAGALLTIGLLAISSGDIQALQMNRKSREDLRAVAAAESMMEMIRRNNKRVNDYNGFNTDLPMPAQISRMAQADFVNWQAQIAAILSDQGGGGAVPFTCGAAQVTRACGYITVTPVASGIANTNMVNIVIVWPGRPNDPNDPLTADAPNTTKGIQFISTVGVL